MVRGILLFGENGQGFSVKDGHPAVSLRWPLGLGEQKGGHSSWTRVSSR